MLIVILVGIVGVMIYIRTQVNLEAGISGTGNVVIENEAPEGLIITQEYVLLALHRNMARETLETYARTLKAEANIDVDFSELTYDNLGRIRYIAMEVDCGDGFAGKTSFPVNTDGFRFGFIRRYDDDAETEFFIGPIEAEDALI